MKIINGVKEESQNKSQLDDMTQYTTVNAVSNTYTLNLQNKAVKNFRISTADAVAKTVEVENVPTECELLLELTYTNASAITWFAGITWLDGVPVLAEGKRYRMLFYSQNGGTSWDAMVIGGW